MSDIIEAAVAALAKKLPNGFPATAKFVIKDEGAIIIDAEGVRAGDDEADVTLIASAGSDTSARRGSPPVSAHRASASASAWA